MNIVWRKDISRLHLKSVTANFGNIYLLSSDSKVYHAGLSETAVEFCKNTQALFAAAGTSNKNIIPESPKSLSELADSLDQVSSYFSELYDRRLQITKRQGCGKTGSFSKESISALKTTASEIRKTFDKINNDNSIINKDRINPRVFVDECSIEHEFGNTSRSSQGELPYFSEYIHAKSKNFQKYIFQSCQTPFHFVTNVNKLYCQPEKCLASAQYSSSSEQLSMQDEFPELFSLDILTRHVCEPF